METMLSAATTVAACSSNNKGKRRRDNSVSPSSSSSSFKGVFMQQNGSWGAQIYANHKRTWLGTFKTEIEAALAYDSAAMKLKTGGDTCRNVPLSNFTIHEPNFQSLYSTEAVLDMLKQGSYYSKLMEFIRNQPEQNKTMERKSSTATEGEVVYHQLFQKELTPSDVGKLNRLVIPKKYAVQYFSDRVGKVEDDLELSFFDRQMREWRFRYCYWESSQSCVFTRGWHRFVKAMGLKSNDVVKFYKCEDDIRDSVFYMIDVEYNSSVTVSGGCSISNSSSYAGNDLLELRLGSGCSTASSSSTSTQPAKTQSSSSSSSGENVVVVALSLGQKLAKKRKIVRIFGADIAVGDW